MEIDQTLSKIKSAGFKLNNLFERSDGQWMANLRTSNLHFFEYAIEDTANEALQTALALAQQHLGMFKNAPGGRPKEAEKFLHQPGEKVPGWDTYQHAIRGQSADDLLGIELDPSEREMAEAAGAISEVDDLLG